MSDGGPSLQTVIAPAKLTLTLRVTALRPDGYHELDAEMVTLDLADTLTFGPGNELSVVDRMVGGTGVAAMPPPDQDLVVRALAAVGRQASVRVVKRIPVGAGLGGGSADAAAVLRWSGTTDPEVAMKLGSDVPFCVVGGRARVRGVGAVLDPLAFEKRSFVLLVPPLVTRTADVYAAWDERHSGESGSGATSSDNGNDLEEAALAVNPALKTWRDVFENVTGRRPRLAGSGSTWFVEGDARDLRVEGRRYLVHDEARAALVPVRTVPSGV